MKKKFFAIVLCFAVALVCAFMLSACGDERNSGNNEIENIDWTTVYTLDGGTVTGLTDYGKTLSAFVIPSEIGEARITAIGDRAFYECDNLTSVAIADSVTSIGNAAFYDCTRLSSVTIGNGVTSIGARAFYDCRNLISITVPQNITSIGEYAFGNCDKLVEIINKSTLNIEKKSNDYGYIGRYALYVHDGASKIVNKDGFRFITDEEGNNYLLGYIGTNTALTLPKNYNGKSYELYDFAFAYSTITSATIPDNLTSISNSAFAGCSNLQNITLNDSVTTIGWTAFHGCTSLTSITIPKNIEEIGEYAFGDCYKLVEVINKSDLDIIQNGSNGAVANYALYVHDGASKIVNKDGFQFITDKDGNNYLLGYIGTNTALTLPQSHNGKNYAVYKYAFSGCTNLTSITIPDSVKSIGESAFKDCSSLTKVNYTGTIDNWVQIEFSNSYSNPLYKAKNLYINNELVTEANITTATKINNYAFSGCTGLTDVTIGSSVSSIGVWAFEGCEDLTSATIGDSVTIIGYQAFRGCTGLTSIDIPNSVTSIGHQPFSDCTNLTYNTYNNAKYLASGDNLYFALIEATSTDITTCEINENCKVVAVAAFNDCTALASITIPSSITNIGASVFDGCKGLTSVYYTGTIDQWAEIEFDHNSSNPLYYAKNLYINNELVTEANITTATKINDYAFNGCGLTSVTIGASVTSIGKWAFHGCAGLTSVTIGESVTSIGGFAFYMCTGLTSIDIPNSVTSIGDRAFYHCSKLTNVTIGSGVTNIGAKAFIACSALTSITVSENNKRYSSVNGIIYNKAQTELVYVLESISGAVTLPDTVTDIPDSAFSDCKKLTSITIGNGVTSIGREAFSFCYDLTSVTIGQNVTSIGNNAFFGCNSLKKVYYNGTASEWDEIIISSSNSKLTSATRYYYSENQPTENGNYWHYDESGNIVEWQ